MARSFSADIAAFAELTEHKITRVVQESTQNVIDKAQLSVAKGGKMRVITGFLRASGRVSLNGFTGGPVRGDPTKEYDYDSSPVELTIAGAKLGQTIYFAWSANYAKYREVYDGFLSSAVQNWQQIVAKNIAKVK